MPENVTPVGARILVEFDEKPQVEDDDDDERYKRTTTMARVTAVGPEYGKKEKGDGKVCPMSSPREMPKLAKGSIVYVACSPEHVFEAEGKFYKFVDPYDIQGVVGSAAAHEMAGPKGKRDRSEPEEKHSKHEEDDDMDY